MPSIPEPSELLDLAVEAATAAGDHALAASREALDISTKDTASDFVTQVDRRCEELIVERLRRGRPDDAISGEEGASVPGTSGVVWHVDPIDGTTNFVYGQPGWSVSIAAEHDGAVRVGVVFDPVHDELYRARLDHGAFVGDEPLAVRGSTPLDAAVVATGFAYDLGLRAHQATVLAGILPAVGNVRRCGSAAVDLCWVGAGRVDAYYEAGLNRWDHAAGALIAAEAGAVVHDLRGGPPSRRFVLAASPSVHDELRDLLVDLDADTPPAPDPDDPRPPRGR